MKVRALKMGLLGVALGMAGLVFGRQQPITVTVNGTPVQFKALPPQMQNGHVLVPLRGVFEQMNAYVQWIPASQTVEAQRGNTTVELQIGNNTAHINQKAVTMDVAPEVISGTTLVPLRFISEALGASVNWVSAQNLVAITTGGAPDEHIEVSHPVIVKHVVQPVVVTQVTPQVIELTPNMVIPVKLYSPLSSNGSAQFSGFQATLETYGQPTYKTIPAGTMVLGHVALARPKNGPHPGVLVLAFDTLVLPNGGPRIPIQGTMVSLNDDNVVRRNGVIVARPGVAQTQNSIAFIGFGSGGGFEVGAFHGGHVVADAHIGGHFGTIAARLKEHPEWARDVFLPKGTEMGVRLTAKVYYRRR